MFVLRVFIEPASIETMRASTPWRNRPVRWVSIDSLASADALDESETRPRVDSVSSIGQTEGSNAAAEAEKGGELSFTDHLAALRLDSFREFLEAQGLTTSSALDARLASLSSLRLLGLQ